MPALSEPIRVNLLSLVPEGEFADRANYLHAEFRVEHAAGSYRGSWLLMRTPDGGYKVDEAVYPLEAPKALALLQPKRGEAGERYLELVQQRR